jgi:hypothetical protein
MLRGISSSTICARDLTRASPSSRLEFLSEEPPSGDLMARARRTRSRARDPANCPRPMTHLYSFQAIRDLCYLAADMTQQFG